MPRTTDYIGEARDHCRRIWFELQALQDMQTEWNARSYGDNLPDGTGINAGITRAMVGAAVFDGADTLTTVMGTVAANFANML